MIDPSAEVAGGEFKWSNSRHSQFSDCKRAWWYGYYGAKVDENIKRLKELSGVALWVGTLVHDTLETFLKTHAANPKKAPLPTGPALEKLIHQVTHGQMPQDWAYSQAATKKFRLWEHEYGKAVSAEEKRIAIGQVVICLRNAFQGPIMEEMLTVGPKNWLSVEEAIDFEVKASTGPVIATGRMDGCYRAADGRVKIFDWKTGRTVGQFNKHQVGGYSLYAFRRGWAREPEEIETTLAYLVIPEYKKAIITWDDLSAAQEFISKSVDGMRAHMRAPEKNTARMEDAPMCGKEWTCKRCNFRKLCYPAWDQAEMALRFRKK